MSDTETFSVTVKSVFGRKELIVQGTQEIHAAIRKAFGWLNRTMNVDFGGMDVAEGETFSDHGIEESDIRSTSMSM